MSVGTRTAGRTSEMSASIAVRKYAAAAPGLRLRRMCVTNQSWNAGSSAASGARSSRSRRKYSRLPQFARTSFRRSIHSLSGAAHG